jgi:hypothetical protein
LNVREIAAFAVEEDFTSEKEKCVQNLVSEQFEDGQAAGFLA